MVSAPEGEAEERPAEVPPFHQRFNIPVEREEVERRFINRAINTIQGKLPDLERGMTDTDKPTEIRLALIMVASFLGVEYKWNNTFSTYASTDLYSCLLSLEALYKSYIVGRHSPTAPRIEEAITLSLHLCETDIGVRWRDGVFWPAGAQLLDKDLVDENLKWLSDLGYHQVATPFEKGLRHFLKPEDNQKNLPIQSPMYMKLSKQWLKLPVIIIKIYLETGRNS